MSKYVKNLVSDELKTRLSGVNDLLFVNIALLDANTNCQLRRELRGKDIHIMMVKNSLARRACEGTPLAAGFEGLAGQTAVMWGGQDIVSLAKEFVRITKEKPYAAIESRGGVMDGARLAPEDVAKVSKWPSRQEQISLLLGQILAPGANLSSQLTSVGGALASQIEQKGKEDESAEAASGEAEPSQGDATAAPA
jgi:large subunit ribosomal protein L10